MTEKRLRQFTQNEESPKELSRLQDFLKFLLEESQLFFAKKKDLERVYQSLTQKLSEMYSIPRVSIWILHNGGRNSYIECANLYELETRKHSSGARLLEKDYPKYFEYIRANIVLSTHDTRTHYYTKDFTAPYLIPMNIHSMLDAPFHLQGKVYGVVCCENTQTLRQWGIEEEQALIAMCNHISSFVSYNHLETLIDERTSELNRKQAQLTQSTKMASLGVMAGGIAHEIKNPLTIIKTSCGLLSRLLQGNQFDPKLFMNNLSSVDSTVDRISTIINSLQSFSREASRDPMRKISAQQIVMDTLAFSADKLRREGIQLKLDLSNDAQILCRPTEISQILLNLIQNACDAIQGSPNPWIRIEVTQRSGKVEYAVTDSGTGITPEVEEMLFDQFFTTKEEGKGTGLGLSLSTGIAQAHGGRLYYDRSCANTRFVLELNQE